MTPDELNAIEADCFICREMAARLRRRAKHADIVGEEPARALIALAEVFESLMADISDAGK